ncbi:MAG: hypothetical protein COA78_36225 [Blastopirellula sp.]|nr:MAG: hypothetical protein COA78_36225 [Blastopirellula sp.]
MSKRAKNHLKKLRDKGTDHPLQAMFVAYIEEPENLDFQISLIGMMHQSGWLRNQIEPYLDDWKVKPAQWVKKCFERLLGTFRGDPLATSALLYSSPKSFFTQVKKHFPHLVYAYYHQNDGKNYRAIFAVGWNGPGSDQNFANQCIEFNWVGGEHEFREIHYTKVISGKDLTDYLHDTCDCAYHTTAHLPHAYWRSENSIVELKSLAEVKKSVAKLPKQLKP